MNQQNLSDTNVSATENTENSSEKAQAISAVTESIIIKHRLTDLGNAWRFVLQHGAKVHYCPEMKQWYTYIDGHWKPDSGSEIFKLAIEVIKKLSREQYRDDLNADEKKAFQKWAERSASKGRINAMLDLARFQPGVPVHPNQLDNDPWLLNCSNGTLNLQTGQLRTHDPADLITRKIKLAYDPNATCPNFQSYLEKIMGGDQDKIAFMRRLAGYFLTGDTFEQCFFIFYGSGANGKTTFLEVMRELLGGYAANTTIKSLLTNKSSSIRSDIARLNRARLVSAVEVGMGNKLDEALVKQLTGGDQVTARFLYHEYFDFKPEFKLVIAANHLPEIRGVDHGIWRRIRIIPFEVSIPPDDIDKDLPAKLKTELPGILAWAVEGCKQWLVDGRLIIPNCITAATQTYREEMDVLENFFDDKCNKEAGFKVKLSELFEAYEQWSKDACLDNIGKKTFGNLMRQKGYSQFKSGSARYWTGIQLVSEK